MPEAILTVEEVAALAGLSRKTVERAIADGRLEARRPAGGGRGWRIAQSAADRWLEGRSNRFGRVSEVERAARRRHS